jgi:hypothetical protein
LKFYVITACVTAAIMLLLVSVLPGDLLTLVASMLVLSGIVPLAFLVFVFEGGGEVFTPALVWHPPAVCILTTAAYFLVSSWSWLLLFLILGSLVAYALHRIVASEFPMQRSFGFLCTGAALCATIFVSLVTQYPK